MYNWVGNDNAFYSFSRSAKCIWTKLRKISFSLKSSKHFHFTTKIMKVSREFAPVLHIFSRKSHVIKIVSKKRSLFSHVVDKFLLFCNFSIFRIFSHISTRGLFLLYHWGFCCFVQDNTHSSLNNK